MGGGAFLLTLSIIAGVLLITVPAQATENNNANVVNAATEVIDGVTYETIYLTGDSNANVAELVKRKDTTGNYRYVLTDDWDLAGQSQNQVFFYGNAVILDLNGHLVQCWRSGGTAVGLRFGCTTVEITDSSSAQTGEISGCATPLSFMRNCQFTFSGGKLNCGGWGIDQYANLDITIRGGSGEQFGVPAERSNGYGLTVNWNSYTLKITFAPWVEPFYHADGRISGWTAHEPETVRDNITYQMVYLTGDSATNLARINACSASGNYYYLMTADWDLVANQVAGLTIRGRYVVWDNNGYNLNAVGYAGGGYFPTYSVTNTLEITSSGRVTGNIATAVVSSALQKFIITGNIRLAYCSFSARPTNIIIRSANLCSLYCGAGFDSVAMTVPPFMQLYYSVATQRAYRTLCDYYAVSDSNLIAGAYNYAMGHAWELTVGELADLSMPTDKTYYLWGRKADGAYEYLNIIYRDGAWVLDK